MRITHHFLNNRYSRSVGTFALVAAGAMIPAACSKGPIDSAAFVTTLGIDTLSTERFRYSPNRVEADVIVRVPQTTHIKYLVDLADDGSLTHMEAVSVAGSSQDTTPIRRQIVTRVGDSLQIETQDSSGTTTNTVAASTEVLPFLEFTHWPFEVAMMRAREKGVSIGNQSFLSGNSVSEFPLEIIGEDSMTLTHPVRGVMRAAVDKQGRLQTLAGPPTRRVVVERVQWLADSEMQQIVSNWANADVNGKGISTLSGRGHADVKLGQASVVLDYGTPLKRGRTIWGDLVPWDKVWRTGANEATKITTDRELVFGEGSGTLRVPAGSYSLFTIPSEDGGTLIVNKQTGHNGARYDETQDLGRVKMTTRKLGESVEQFTIALNDPENPGMLEVQWDTLALVVPVKVR